MSAPIDVAVGVLIRPDGSFLIAQRPPGKPMAGYWEFPGGKLEPGESVFDALVREYQEELGLAIRHASPWAQRVFVYPHATVRLHYWRVFEWAGEPVAQEGQSFRWESVGHIVTAPWLPGALPLKRWLTLPQCLAISNATELGTAPFLERLDAWLDMWRNTQPQPVATNRHEPESSSGVAPLLQLREKALNPEAFEYLFTEVHARTRAYGVRLLVNSDHPQSYWERADGVHCTARTVMTLKDRPAVDWCGASCHDADELAHAGRLDFDFAVLGPVQPTASHPAATPLGWAEFARLVRQTEIPVYALGGLARTDVPQAIRSGAQGVAAMRAFWK